MDRLTPSDTSIQRWEQLLAEGQDCYNRWDFDHAEKHWLAAVQQAGKIDPSHPRVAHTMHLLAAAYTYAGRRDPAEALHRRALKIRRRALGRQSLEVAHSLEALSGCAWVRGDPGCSESLLLKALAIRQEVEDGTPAVAENLNCLGLLRRNLGEFDEAEELFHEALAIQQDIVGEVSENAAHILTNLGVSYLYAGKNDEALAVLRRAQSIETSLHLGDGAPHACTLFALADALARHEQVEEAVGFAGQALRIWEKMFGPDDPVLVTPLISLTKLHSRLGNWVEAARFALRALPIAEKDLGPTHPRVGEILGRYCDALRVQGLDARAEPLSRRSLAILEGSYGPEHQQTVIAQLQLAQIRGRQGDWDEAESLLRQALETSDRWPDFLEPSQMIELLEHLANVIDLSGPQREAVAMRARAAELRRQHPEACPGSGPSQDAAPHSI